MSHVCSPSQLKTEFLPLLSVVFVTENSVVAAVSTRPPAHRRPPPAGFQCSCAWLCSVCLLVGCIVCIFYLLIEYSIHIPIYMSDCVHSQMNDSQPSCFAKLGHASSSRWQLPYVSQNVAIGPCSAIKVYACLHNSVVTILEFLTSIRYLEKYRYSIPFSIPREKIDHIEGITDNRAIT